jgi:hypothetical protein
MMETHTLSVGQQSTLAVLENFQLSSHEKLRQFRELLKSTENDHGLAYISKPDGSAVIAVASIDNKKIVTIPTKTTQQQYQTILDKILPLPETQAQLYELGVCYANRWPIILVGGTAIGKTFCVNRFAEFLYGPDAKIPDFYCNGQTDVSELMGKYVPARLRPEQLKQIDDYLKSDAGAALRAEMLQQNNRVEISELMERAAFALGLPIRQGSFVFQLGVLPKAMTATMSPEGAMLETPDGPGCMLHIQEVGMAQPPVINALFKIRGEKGKLATQIQVHEDGGRLIQAGQGFFLVLSTNPPGKGFKERFEIDPALARALQWKTLPDELSKESMRKVAAGIFNYSKVERQSDSPGAIIDLMKHPELCGHISTVLLDFHNLYVDKLRDKESGNKQKIPATIDSLWKIAALVQNNQIPYETRNGVDLVTTIKAAVQGVYIDGLRDKPDFITPQSLSKVTQESQSLGAALLEQLDEILNGSVACGIRVEGPTLSRSTVIERLADDAFGGAESNLTIVQAKDQAEAVAAGIKVEKDLKALESLVSASVLEALREKLSE